MNSHGIAYRTTVFTILGCLLTAGCLREPSPREDATISSGDIRLSEIDGPGLAKAVARHRGNVVLVDYWATWCAPCVRLFPHTVEMHRRLAGRGLAVISLSLDEPEERDSVLQFLRKHGATFENYISRYGLGAEGFDAFQIDDGALPHLKLFGRDGRLLKTFTSGDPKKIDLAVEKALSARNADGENEP